MSSTPGPARPSRTDRPGRLDRGGDPGRFRLGPFAHDVGGALGGRGADRPGHGGISPVVTWAVRSDVCPPTVATGFSRTPSPSIEMRTTSPGSSVNGASG